MKRIHSCFDKSIINLCDKIETLNEITCFVRSHLPEHLSHSTHVLSVTHGCLILGVDDPIWATELRFLLPTLRDRLRGQHILPQLISIQIKLYYQPPQHNKSKCSAKLTLKAREAIKLAEEKCEYEPLRNVWRKLRT